MRLQRRAASRPQSGVGSTLGDLHFPITAAKRVLGNLTIPVPFGGSFSGKPTYRELVGKCSLQTALYELRVILPEPPPHTSQNHASGAACA
jgi:hypothetical protein